MAKKGLGKGLGALIRENNDSEIMSKNAVVELRVTEIESNKEQPRKYFNDDALESLEESILEHGVVQPIIVRKLEHGYQIVAGERRWRASRKAGLKTIPAIVKDFSDVEVMEVALIENIQREDLNPIEEALAYESLLQDYNMTQEVISKRIGKSRPSIANSIRLLSLDSDIKDMLICGKITSGHARALLSIDSSEKRLDIAKKIYELGLNVREIEKISKEKKQKKNTNIKKDIHIIEIEEKLKTIYGTKVNITYKNSKGKVEIEYYNNDDLNRILDLLEN